MVTKLERKICHQIFVTKKMGTFYWGQTITIFKNEYIIQDFPEFIAKSIGRIF